MPNLTELEMDYPNYEKAAPAMIRALEAVLGSYILFTGSAQETPDMKRARTLVGMALDEARGIYTTQIPSGYRILAVGEPMQCDDLFWSFEDKWERCGECDDVGFPWNSSYRAFIRKI